MPPKEIRPKTHKVVKTDQIILPEGHIAGVETSNQYLGIPGANRKHDEVIRKAATGKYQQRGRQVLRSQPHGKNKVWASRSSHTLLE